MTVRRKDYEKPTIKKHDKMVFVLRGINATAAGPACRQCSSCHGCR